VVGSSGNSINYDNQPYTRSGNEDAGAAESRASAAPKAGPCYCTHATAPLHPLLQLDTTSTLFRCRAVG